jgi:hypothetical protein
MKVLLGVLIALTSLLCVANAQAQQPTLYLSWDGTNLAYQYSDPQGNDPSRSGLATPGQATTLSIPVGANIVSVNSAPVIYAAGGYTYGLPVIFCFDSPTPNSGTYVTSQNGCSTCVSAGTNPPPTRQQIGHGSIGGNYGPGYLVNKFCSVASCLDLAKGGQNSGSQTLTLGNAPLTVTVGNVYGNIGRRPNPNYSPINAGYIVLNIIPQGANQGTWGVSGSGSGSGGNSWGQYSNNQGQGGGQGGWGGGGNGVFGGNGAFSNWL